MEKFWDEIVDKVPVETAIRDYTGAFPNRAGFICCPLHGEKTPSLSIKGNKWHCFGCGEGGNVINFVMKFFDLDFMSACKKLDDDYNLKLGLGRTKEDLERKRQREREEYIARKKLERYNKWKEEYIARNYKKLISLQEEAEKYHSLLYKNPSDPYHPIIKKQVVNIDGVDYELENEVNNFNYELTDDEDFQYQIEQYIKILKQIDKIELPSEAQLQRIYNSSHRVYRYNII